MLHASFSCILTLSIGKECLSTPSQPAQKLWGKQFPDAAKICFKYTLTASTKGLERSCHLQVFIVKKIGILLKQEFAQMCSDKAKSFFQYQSASALEFEWDTLIAELSIHAHQFCCHFIAPALRHANLVRTGVQ